MLPVFLCILVIIYEKVSGTSDVLQDKSWLLASGNNFVSGCSEILP